LTYEIFIEKRAQQALSRIAKPDEIKWTDRFCLPAADVQRLLVENPKPSVSPRRASR
jgi:hypothetical protein